MTFLVWRYGCCGSCIAIDADWLTTLGDFGNLETVSKVFHTKGNGGGRKIRKEEARDEAKFVRTERKKLLPSEIRCLRATFDHLGRNTLLAKDIDAALKTEEFARMFNDIKMRENQFRVQNDSDIKVLLQNAYRASKRGEQK